MSFTNLSKNFSRSFSVIVIFAALFTAAAIYSSAQTLYAGEKITRNKAEMFNILATETAEFAVETEQSEKKIETVKDSSVFAEFENWLKQNENQNFSNLSEHNGLGEKIAIRRREILKTLIQQDPKAALEKAISPEISENLPSFIIEHLEKRVSARGDFLVYSLDKLDRANGQMMETNDFRQVLVGDSKYKAYVYGRRETMTTKLDIPLQGIVIDDMMAVDENPVRRINRADYSNRADDETSSVAASDAVEVGGKVVYFSNQAELNNFVDEQIKWESTIGPARPKNDSAQSSLSPEQVAATFTTGPKTVLFIRADFPDKPGVPLDRENQPLSVDKVQSLFANEVNPFYRSNSYGKTSVQATVTQEIIRLPHTLAYYAQSYNFNEMYEDARVAARARGYETNNFDFDIVGFSYTDAFYWAGNSLVGTKGNLLNGAFYGYETSHELGHNYGLQHAHFWRPTPGDGTAIGSGTDEVVGDCFDIMGYCSEGTKTHFNARYKNILDWLIDDADVQTITQNGTYRIYAQDISQNGLRALKIKKNDTINYWVEFRQLIAGNAMNGALIRRENTSQEYKYTQLLDMNPSTSTANDAALAIGQTFLDSASGIKITVLRKGGTNPESLDVNVEVNKSVNCAYTLGTANFRITATGSIGGQTTISAGGDCAWTAVSNDSWITIMSGSGSGPGEVSFAVQRNDSIERNGTITVAGLTIYVKQYAGSCGYSVTPEILNVPASGGALNYAQAFSPGCNSLTPVLVGTSPWININTNPPTVSPNTGNARSGTLKLTGEDINGSTFQISLIVNQSGASTCSFSVSPTTNNLIENTGLAGNINVTVTSGSGCQWTAISNADWITITSGANGNGNGTVNFSVAANSSAARTGSITVAGQIITLSQAGGKSRKRVRFF